jgi:PAS domain S-box-containing protein
MLLSTKYMREAPSSERGETPCDLRGLSARRFGDATIAASVLLLGSAGEVETFEESRGGEPPHGWACWLPSRGEDYLSWLSRQPDATEAGLESVRAVLRGDASSARTSTAVGEAAAERWVDITVQATGSASPAFVAIHVDVTEARRTAALQALQDDVLASLAAGRSTSVLLEQLVRAVERQLPMLRCSVLRLDNDGKHLRLGAAPSLPKAFSSLLNGIAVGPQAGSCGTAIYRREAVIVSDIATDPLWVDVASLVLGHGLRACWSFPLFPVQQEGAPEDAPLLGALAFYSETTRSPDAWCQRVATWAAHLASLALELERRHLALRESEHRLQTLADASPVGMFRTDRAGSCTFVNRRWCAIAGATQADALSDRWTGAIHPDDRARVYAAWSQAVKAGSCFQLEYRFLAKNGACTWVLGSAEPERGDDGEVAGFVGSITDITDRKVSEIELRASNERFATFAATTNDTLWDWHVPTSQIWWSPTLSRLLGHAQPAPETGLAWWREHVHPGDLGRLERRVADVRSGRQLGWDDEYRLRRADGSYADILDRGQVLPDGAGAPVRMVGVLTDISRLKEAEMALRELNYGLEQRVETRTAELAAANRELEAFSYSVSHDLRAPLRAIDGFSRIVMEDYGAALCPDATDYLAEVRRSTRRMGELVDDLLVFSRLGRQLLRRQRVDADAQMREAFSTVRAAADDVAGRRLELTVAHPLPPCDGDASLLQQVWLNLLGNAVKYSQGRDRSRVEVGFSTSEVETTYFVRDNGVGFDMQYAHKLFGVFQRLHRAEDYEGTGVGLAIVQRIVHRHGGRVWAEAEIDAGATFYFTLPTTGPLPS